MKKNIFVKKFNVENVRISINKITSFECGGYSASINAECIAYDRETGIEIGKCGSINLPALYWDMDGEHTMEMFIENVRDGSIDIDITEEDLNKLADYEIDVYDLDDEVKEKYDEFYNDLHLGYNEDLLYDMYEEENDYSDEFFENFYGDTIENENGDVYMSEDDLYFIINKKIYLESDYEEKVFDLNTEETIKKLTFGNTEVYFNTFYDILRRNYKEGKKLITKKFMDNNGYLLGDELIGDYVYYYEAA